MLYSILDFIIKKEETLVFSASAYTKSRWILLTKCLVTNGIKRVSKDRGKTEREHQNIIN